MSRFASKIEAVKKGLKKIGRGSGSPAASDASSVEAGSPASSPRRSLTSTYAAIDYKLMPLADFVRNLVGREDEAAKAQDAKLYIKTHRGDGEDFGFENVKMIGDALRNEEGNPYSKEEALLLGIEAVGKNPQNQQKLVEGYVQQLRGDEKIGVVAGLLLNDRVPDVGKSIIAGYLNEKRKEDAAEYFVSLSDEARDKAIQAIPELNGGLAKAVIDKQNALIVSSGPVSVNESLILSRAITYEDGNPDAAKEFIETKRSAKEVREGIVQIIRERRLQDRDTTYADIAAMLSYAPLPVQTIETFQRGIAPSKLKVEDVIPFAIRTFAGEETRAVGGAGATEDNPGLFIKGLDLSQDQVLSLGGDPSIPKEYLGKIIAQDLGNMEENALEIGKARSDLSFQEVKDLLPEGTVWDKPNAQIFVELADTRIEDPESASKLVEGLTLDQVVQYSKDGGLDLRATGMMMREVSDVTLETLEPHYINALAAARIDDADNNSQGKRFAAFQINTAYIAGDTIDGPGKFRLAAKAILHEKEDKAEIIKQICKEASHSLDEKLELLSAGEVHKFKKAWEITSVASEQKSEFFLKFVEKFEGKSAPAAMLEGLTAEDFQENQMKVLAFKEELPVKIREELAKKIIASKEEKKHLTQDERLKLERLKKGSALTKEEYFNHALDHAIIGNKGQEVENLLGKLDGQDRRAKLKFIDDLSAKYPELKIKVKKTLGERFSLGLRRIWPFGKVPVEKQQEEMVQKVDLSDGLEKVNEVLFKRRERVMEASSRDPEVRLTPQDLGVLIKELAQFEVNKRTFGTPEYTSQYYETEDPEQAMREEKVRLLVNGDKILERIREIPEDCTKPQVIKHLVHNAFTTQLVMQRTVAQGAIPQAKAMFLSTYEKLCYSLERDGESADYRACAEEMNRNKQLLLEKAPELDAMFTAHNEGRTLGSSSEHAPFFTQMKTLDERLRKEKTAIETRSRGEEYELIAEYAGGNKAVKDYQSRIKEIGKCDIGISMLSEREEVTIVENRRIVTKETEADVVKRVNARLQATQETKALYEELKDRHSKSSEFLYQDTSPEIKELAWPRSLSEDDKHYNAEVERYNAVKAKICGLFGAEPKQENLQSIIKIANAKESFIGVEGEIGLIKAQLIEKRSRIEATMQEKRKEIVQIVKKETGIIAQEAELLAAKNVASSPVFTEDGIGAPTPPPRTVSAASSAAASSRDVIIETVKRPRAGSNASTSPSATPTSVESASPRSPSPGISKR